MTVKQIKEVLNNCEDITLESTIIKGQYFAKCKNGCGRIIRFKRMTKGLEDFLIEYKVGLYLNSEEWWSSLMVDDFIEEIRKGTLRSNL